MTETDGPAGANEPAAKRQRAAKTWPRKFAGKQCESVDTAFDHLCKQKRNAKSTSWWRMWIVKKEADDVKLQCAEPICKEVVSAQNPSGRKSHFVEIDGRWVCNKRAKAGAHLKFEFSRAATAALALHQAQLAEQLRCLCRSEH